MFGHVNPFANESASKATAVKNRGKYRTFLGQGWRKCLSHCFTFGSA